MGFLWFPWNVPNQPVIYSHGPFFVVKASWNGEISHQETDWPGPIRPAKKHNGAGTDLGDIGRSQKKPKIPGSFSEIYYETLGFTMKHVDFRW